jgi:hypothetical protein
LLTYPGNAGTTVASLCSKLGCPNPVHLKSKKKAVQNKPSTNTQKKIVDIDKDFKSEEESANDEAEKELERHLESENEKPKKRRCTRD